MYQNRPFIYISGLPRTGSTLLSEALTRLPDAFILNEPHLGKNYFAVQAADAERLAELGIDLHRFRRRKLGKAFLLRRLRPFGFPQDYLLRRFKAELVPDLLAQIEQIGVKEIKHQGWENYAEHFGGMKAVMLGRDPRDLYLSYYRLWKTGVVSWEGQFNPRTVSDFYTQEFRKQLRMREIVDTLCVRYEDLCTKPEVFDSIKRFVSSPLDGVGEIGAFVSRHPIRRDEQARHGIAISSNSVSRWRAEADTELLSMAEEFCLRMKAYRNFWDYPGP